MTRLPTFAKNKVSTYVAKTPDHNGFVHYTAEEHATWQQLYARQLPLLKNHACDAFMRGLDILQLPNDRIPQCAEISAKLMHSTQFSVEPVAALIPDEQFFFLLSQRKFPAATFIRRQDELNYLQEPDLFHEFFGHCPMLTDPAYADFSQEYGKLALTYTNDEIRHRLARLYWFTIEFGLIQTKQGIKAYGGGILSSPGELPYATDSDKPERKLFDVLEVLRTPYRIDIYQAIYFVIHDFSQLYSVLDDKLPGLITKSQQLGDFEPTFPTGDLL